MMDHSIVGIYDQYWNMIAKIIWLVVSTPLKNMKVNWFDDSQLNGKIKVMFKSLPTSYLYITYLHRILKRQSLKSQSSMSAFSKAAMQLRKFQRLEVPAPPEVTKAEEVNRKPNLELGKSEE